MRLAADSYFWICFTPQYPILGPCRQQLFTSRVRQWLFDLRGWDAQPGRIVDLILGDQWAGDMV
jgi:hypothetical protein